MTQRLALAGQVAIVQREASVVFDHPYRLARSIARRIEYPQPRDLLVTGGPFLVGRRTVDRLRRGVGRRRDLHRAGQGGAGRRHLGFERQRSTLVPGQAIDFGRQFGDVPAAGRQPLGHLAGAASQTQQQMFGR